MLTSGRVDTLDTKSGCSSSGSEGEVERDVADSAGVGWNAVVHTRDQYSGERYRKAWLTRRGGGVHAVAHVAEGANGDADRLVLVFESGMFDHGVHRCRLRDVREGRDDEKVGVEVENWPPANVDIKQITVFFT